MQTGIMKAKGNQQRTKANNKVRVLWDKKIISAASAPQNATPQAEHTPTNCLLKYMIGSIYRY